MDVERPGRLGSQTGGMVSARGWIGHPPRTKAKPSVPPVSSSPEMFCSYPLMSHRVDTRIAFEVVRIRARCPTHRALGLRPCGPPNPMESTRADPRASSGRSPRPLRRPAAVVKSFYRWHQSSSMPLGGATTSSADLHRPCFLRNASRFIRFFLLPFRGTSDERCFL